jgi:hypothetical protein
MSQRLAITVSSLVAAGVLAVGLTAAGFGPGSRTDFDPAAQVVAAEAVAGTPVETIEPEVVYVKPAPKPKTVVVKKRITAGSSATSTRSGAASGKSDRVRATRVRDDEREYEREREHEYEDD